MIEKQFDNALEKTIKILKFCEENDEMPIIVFKPTGFGRFLLYQKKTEGEVLSAD